jgi:anti-anti-sigma factor
VTSVTTTQFRVVSEPNAVECVIEVHGEIARRSAPRLRGALRYALGGRPEWLVLDLSDADLVDDAGLAVLVAADRTAKDHGMQLLLCGLNDAAVTLLRSSNLHTVLKVVPTLSAKRASSEGSL